MSFLRFALFVLSSLVCIAAPAQSWHLAKTFHPGGDGGWDYVTVDASHHRFFVTRRSYTQVIDTRTGKLLATIPGQIISHGVALVPRLNRGFITDGGGSGAILVFDLNTLKVLGRIPTMPDSDGIIYDRGTDLIVAVSGDGNALMTFRPDIHLDHPKVTTIALGGAPEFLAADGGGRAYVNLEDKGLLAVVDLHTNKVLERWPVAPAGHPTGMAIDPATHHLFIGGRNPAKLVVIDTRSGKVEAALPIGSINDAVVFNRRHVYASCGGGTLSIIGEQDGHFTVEQTVETAPGARTMGLDDATQEIFLPTADALPSPSGRRPQYKPGTFKIVVVSKH